MRVSEWSRMVTPQAKPPVLAHEGPSFEEMGPNGGGAGLSRPSSAAYQVQNFFQPNRVCRQ